MVNINGINIYFVAQFSKSDVPGESVIMVYKNDGELRGSDVPIRELEGLFLSRLDLNDEAVFHNSGNPLCKVEQLREFERKYDGRFHFFAHAELKPESFHPDFRM